jgi:hypothetical protein
MVERGLLHCLHRGVFAFGARSPAPEAKWAAALLAAGEGSALSHTSAAAFYGQVAVRAVTEVIAPTRRRGDETLKVRTAKRYDVVEKRRLRVTTPAQTLLDLAAIGWPIDRMTHEMAAASLVSLDDLRTFARNRRGEPGATALKEALNLPHTRSQWERDFFAWLKTLTDIPPPILNDPIGHLTVDCQRDDKERDAWLEEQRGKEVWRVRRETFDRAAVAEGLRRRLAS